MRRPQLEMLKGGGEPPTCQLCDRGLYLDGTRDDEVRLDILSYMAKLPGRITVCSSHREDLEAMRVSLAPTAPALQDVSQGANRRERRGRDAVVRRISRATAKRRARTPETEPEGGAGGGICL